jgi:hypothetical protein
MEWAYGVTVACCIVAVVVLITRYGWGSMLYGVV